MCSWIELYVGKRHLKLKLHAFSHIVGADVTNNNEWLSKQLAARLPTENTNAQPSSSIRLNSRFNYNNNLYKIVQATDQGIEALCLWGENQGQMAVFPETNQVIDLVNKKHRLLQFYLL